MLTGSRSNVHPSYYDGPPHAEGTWEDLARDGTTLPLIRAAVARGVPVLAICRGFQELNVALGGSLHQRLQDLPDRIDHSSPMVASREVRIGKAHGIRVTPGGWLHRLAGATRDRGQLAAQPGRQPAGAGCRASKAPRRTARSRRCMWSPPPRARCPASPSACSGIRRTTGRPTSCPAASSRTSPPPCMPMPRTPHGRRVGRGGLTNGASGPVAADHPLSLRPFQPM